MNCVARTLTVRDIARGGRPAFSVEARITNVRDVSATPRPP